VKGRWLRSKQERRELQNSAGRLDSNSWRCAIRCIGLRGGAIELRSEETGVVRLEYYSSLTALAVGQLLRFTRHSRESSVRINPVIERGRSQLLTTRAAEDRVKIKQNVNCLPSRPPNC
jgi:hypothetical protein